MSEFKPEEHLTDIKGKKYLEVKWRLVWFREEHPDWTIETQIKERVPEGAIVKAVIRDNEGRVMATAHKMETKQGFGDYLEKAETGAIGRSLALLGFGTQFTTELEEGERIVDAPVKGGMEQAEKDLGNANDVEWKTGGTWDEPATSKQVDKLSSMYGSFFREAIEDLFGLENPMDMTKGQASYLFDDDVRQGIRKRLNVEEAEQEEVPF